MTVQQLLRMTAAAAAQLLYDRAPSKAWALRRSLDALLDGGSAPKPASGWATTRVKEPANFGEILADAMAAAGR
jgi:hypothetical protein